MNHLYTDPDGDNPHASEDTSTSITDKRPTVSGNVKGASTAFLPPPPLRPEDATPVASLAPTQPLRNDLASSTCPTQPLRNNRRTVRLVVMITVVVILIVASVSTIYAVGQGARNIANGNATAIAGTGTAQVRAAATAHIIASATTYASLNPYPAFQTVAMNEALTANSDSAWIVGVNRNNTYKFQGTCAFVDGSYVVSASYATAMAHQPNFSTSCLAVNSNFVDFVFQVQIRSIRGNCGGLLFRGNNQFAHFYAAVICQDGTYAIIKADGKARTYLARGKTTLFKVGFQQTNLVAIVAQGNTFAFYINKEYITSTKDSAYQQGMIGVLASPRGKSTEVLYNNAQVWIP